jgi:hypothetical protein
MDVLSEINAMASQYQKDVSVTIVSFGRVRRLEAVFA